MVGTTALMIMGGTALAGQAAGAINSARAANKAGKQQAAGAAQARAPIEEAYRTQMGLMDPYAALGRQSANTLGRLMQPGVGYTPQMQAMDAQQFQNTPPGPWAMPQQPTGQRPSGVFGNQYVGTQPTVGAPVPNFMPFAQPQMPPGAQYGGPSRIRAANYRRPSMRGLIPAGA